MPEHFKGKDAFGHVAETQAKGIISATEIHGAEIPGHLSAGADAARDTAVILLLLSPWFTPWQLLFFACGWLVWRMGRSAALSWSRLERLHRILAQEKWEIEHNRPQERDELRALYGAKGFQGKLLEDVVDVLMADGDRLLRVMVEEEMGISLQTVEHPLKQSVGAGVGTALSFILCAIGGALHLDWGVFLCALIAVAISATVYASYSQNRIIPAIIWNLALGILAFGTTFYLSQSFHH
jgi:hypothetical protein